DYIHAVETASLDNGDLSEDVVDRIRNPPQSTLNISDPNDVYSLKQFLAAQHSSQQTYHDFQLNHNERYPQDPMLSLEQVKSRIAAWTGVETIEQDMCRRFCMAF
ncbi:hypothetical protein JB92DRAFT_2674762, partial [Gautieria morchelliformis]